MPTFTKNILSSSTDGRAILVAATATAGTLIHTGPTTVSSFDEVWLYAYNSAATNTLLTIEFGGVTSPNDHIKVTIPSQNGVNLVVPGNILKGNATALLVRAFAATTNVVTVSGYVHNIV